MKRLFGFFTLSASAIIFSFGFNVFLRPAGVAPGGISGLSLLINYLIPALPVGALSLLFNLPLFWIGFKKIGGSFVLKSVFASVLISILFDLYPFVPKIGSEPILAAIFGGVIMGTGMGLAFLSGGSTGGIDILIRLLRKKYPQLSIGQFLLLMDAFIVVASGLVFQNINNALYAMIAMYATSVSLDAVLYGLNYAKCALIITDKAYKVNSALLSALTRGTTIIPCMGGFEQKGRHLILCAINKGQIMSLKEAVFLADPSAFVIMCDANEVLGLGFNSHNKNSL